jgi:UDP-glucuronate decarboxylase
MLAARPAVRLATDRRADASEVSFRPLPIDDPWHRRPDISTARMLLGWTQHTLLDEGLRATAHYFRTRLDERRALTQARIEAN